MRLRAKVKAFCIDLRKIVRLLDVTFRESRRTVVFPRAGPVGGVASRKAVWDYQFGGSDFARSYVGGRKISQMGRASLFSGITVSTHEGGRR